MSAVININWKFRQDGKFKMTGKKQQKQQWGKNGRKEKQEPADSISLPVHSL